METLRKLIESSPYIRRIILPLILVGVAHLFTMLIAPYIAPSIFPLYFIAVIMAVYFDGLWAGLSAALMSAVLSHFVGESSAAEEIMRSLIFLISASLVSLIHVKRVKAERLYHESELRSRRFADEHAQPIISIDQHGKIVYANRALGTVLGYDYKNLLGKSIEILMPQEYREPHHKAVDRYLATGVKVRNWKGTEIPFLAASGEVIPFEMTFGETVSGGVHLFTGFLRDLREQKTKEFQLAEYTKKIELQSEELEAANKSKDHFLAVLSHKLRTPLVSILGYTNMLSSGKMTEEQKEKAIKTISRNAKMQVELIEDLLDISRIITGKIHLEKETIAVCPVVNEVVEALRPSAISKGIKLTSEFRARDVFIKADRRRLAQVVMNIVQNAIKFTDRGEVIVIEDRDASGNCRIVVEDTGIGMEADTISHLFERFRQAEPSTTRRKGGLGLGLSIVKTLSDLHGWKVKAESGGINKGSTFTVTMDCCKPEPFQTVPDLTTGEAIMPVEKELTNLSLVGLTMLVVDDDEDTRTMLKFAFERYGARVFEAENASSARRVIAEHEDVINVFIFDIGMPDEDGYSLMKSIRERGNRTPALALTAFVGQQYEDAAAAAGFNAYLAKPASLQYLVRKILEIKS